MRRTVSVILLIFIAFSAFSQTSPVKPTVDERTELLSIVFRLAGSDEYVNNAIPAYVKDIDTWFAPSREGELIKYAQKLGKTSGVSYDAVMSMAGNLVITDSIRLKVHLKENSLDKRWGKPEVEKFIKLLNRFYVETKFHEFFENHKALYSVAENNFSKILTQVDFTWFQSFYGGKPAEGFNLIISLVNGGGNYGVKAMYNDGREDIYAIMGSWKTDSLGQPVYTKDVIGTIIHEYNHSFCNPLIDAYFKQMEDVAGKFYKEEKDVLQQQAYGTAKTMCYEILVRACVIKYYQTAKLSPEAVNRMIIAEKSRGFLWINYLVDELSVYEGKRDKYPQLKDFMPEIVSMQNRLTPSKLKAEFDFRCARIVSSNIADKSKKVDPGITEITLKFDVPMNTTAKGLRYGKKGKEYFPEIPKNARSKWDKETKTEWSLPVTLKPGTWYSISFPAEFFLSEEGYPLAETYYLDFKTR